MLRWWRRAAFLLLPACFHPNYDHPACGSHGECPSGSSCSPALVCEVGGGGDGGTIDAAPLCFGNLIRVCFSALKVPTMPRMLGSTTINTDMTDSGSLCNQDNDQKTNYCVVAGTNVALMAGATLTAQGLKPLVLLSTTTMDLAGDIDVSSHHAGDQLQGAGANPAGACSFMTAPTEATMGGGGYGGSFGTKGGDGGNAAGQTAGKGAAGTRLDSFPMTLRGGCKGGDGSANAGTVGAGGDGGGAIALVAGMQINVDSHINASGGGGHGASLGGANGGGGGGSGGMIVLDSSVPLTFGARTKFWANGGSGGQGGAGVAGADGEESTGPMQIAFGTNGVGTGGDSGAGSLGAGVGGAGADASIASSGGGGGGGGGGFIHAPGLSGPTLISPPSSGP